MILGTEITESDQNSKLNSLIVQFHRSYKICSSNKGISSNLIRLIKKIDQVHSWPDEYKLSKESYEILRQCISEEVLELPENNSVRILATKIGLIGEHLKDLATQPINLNLIISDDEDVPQTAISKLLEIIQEIALENPSLVSDKPTPTILKQVVKLILAKIDEEWHLYSIELRSDLKTAMPLIRKAS